MANYSMTPYAFAINPRNARGGERRPINDIDGNGVQLRALIEAELHALDGDDLILDPEDDSKSLRVVRLYPYEQFIFVEFGVGRAGLVGTLHQRGGGRVGYAADEHNESLIRGIFVFPSDAHEAYWLSERAGNTSAFSYMENLLLRTIRARVPEFTVKIDAVADWAAIRSWSQNVVVQEMRFDSPRAGSSTQAMDANGFHGKVQIIVKPRGVTLNRIVGDGGPNRDAVYGFLSSVPLVAAGHTSAETIIGEGWRARVAFKNPAGRQRSFGLNIEEKGPTLVYEVGSNAPGLPRAHRPNDSQFASACGDFLIDVAGRLPVGATVAADIVSRVL